MTTPADVARKYARPCPVCKAHPPLRAKCRCCGGEGRIIRAQDVAAIVIEERARAADGLYAVEKFAEEVRETIAQGRTPRVVQVEPADR